MRRLGGPRFHSSKQSFNKQTHPKGATCQLVIGLLWLLYYYVSKCDSFSIATSFATLDAMCRDRIGPCHHHTTCIYHVSMLTSSLYYHVTMLMSAWSTLLPQNFDWPYLLHMSFVWCETSSIKIMVMSSSMWCHLWPFLRWSNFDPKSTFDLFFHQNLTTHILTIWPPINSIQVALSFFSKYFNMVSISGVFEALQIFGENPPGLGAWELQLKEGWKRLRRNFCCRFEDVLQQKGGSWFIWRNDF